MRMIMIIMVDDDCACVCVGEGHERWYIGEGLLGLISDGGVGGGP